MTAVQRPDEIDAEWNTLDSVAQSMKSEASSARDVLDTAGRSWRGTHHLYQEPTSQSAVWTALDDIPQITQDNFTVVESLALIIQRFGEDGARLSDRAKALNAEADHLEQQALQINNESGEDPEGDSGKSDAINQRITEHNWAVAELNRDWAALREESADRLVALKGHGGREEEVPTAEASGDRSVSTAIASSPSNMTDLATMVSALSEPSNVEEAEELYDATMSEDATAEDINNFYDHMAEMSPEEIESFTDAREEVNEQSLPGPSTDEEYADWPGGYEGAEWWDQDEAWQNAMLAHMPLMVGNTQGVPYTTRDQANQHALTKLQSSGNMGWPQERRLNEIEESLEPGQSGDRYLLSLDLGQPEVPDNPHGQGPRPLPKAAVSVGNPDTAHTTSFNVPGMSSGTHNMSGEVAMAQGFYNDLADDDQEHAQVAWVGYDAPTMRDAITPEDDVWEDDKAEAGGYALAHELDGYNETMAEQGRDTTVSLNTHSYGSNTGAHALTTVEHNVDMWMIYGSSGIPPHVAETAEDVSVNSDADGNPAVYATEAPDDNTAGLGRSNHRIDPTDQEFGAQVFASDGVSGNIEGEPTDGHSRFFSDWGAREFFLGERFGYWEPDSQSYNTSLVILEGRADEVDFL